MEGGSRLGVPARCSSLWAVPGAAKEGLLGLLKVCKKMSRGPSKRGAGGWAQGPRLGR